MGSSSSRLGARPSRGRVNRTNRRLSSFFCGGSTSHAPVEMEDYPADVVVNSSEDHDPVIPDELQSSTKEPSSRFNSGTETGASSESSNWTIEERSVKYCSGSVATRNDGKFLSESKELVPDQILEEGMCSSCVSHQELGDSCANAAPSAGNHVDASMDVLGLVTDSISSAFEPQVTSQSLEGESAPERVPPAPGLVEPDRERDRRNGNVLHVDVVSISSSILGSSTAEVSSREARRNSRRLFWDAFSRRSSRRHIDSPTIVFSTEDADDLGMHDRWLLDFGGDLFEDGFDGDSGYLGSRSHGMNERRWSSRSEIWERLHGGPDESGRRTSFCASGLHPDGTCSCESFSMTEESGTHASISRIVMLAEALFEVLDEIHRQPMSLSLSMVSVPAPESVVNSFPIKIHKNTAECGHDMEQCYICLSEYEEGDKIRVLPCRHEYHMACVDKWLKEIHGVCPLCRGNVCEGVAQSTVSN
ncbi:uncharacterized protein LOC122653145 isoform X2 [Telopea speciosissima]|uniref:uncharacterized protein LOC122653145 isoform X2 n=1 Tax=Telopea speciosissima TaxID=54955 RepID=UPI001CC6C38E|nr:uncharacterized protein LOC122653145 isoform X2 [Telopea speciosissima]